MADVSAPSWPRTVTVLAGGIGGSRFIRGLLAALSPGGEVTVIGNTADDIALYGLHISPDLDTVMYTLGGGIDEEQGWGRSDETSWRWRRSVPTGRPTRGSDSATATSAPTSPARRCWRQERRERGDRDPLPALATGGPAAPDDRRRRPDPHRDRGPGAADGTRRMHFQEYWVRLHAEAPAAAVDITGAAASRPAPGVLDAIATADLVVFPPSNPVVSIGSDPGRARDRRSRACHRSTGGRDQPGDLGGTGARDGQQALPAVGVDTSAAGIGLHYGARSAGGLLDAFLVDSADGDAVERLEAAGLRCAAVPLWMSDVEATATIARHAVSLVDPTAPVSA